MSDPEKENQMSGRGGIYPGPNGEQLHGDGQPVGAPKRHTEACLAQGERHPCICGIPPRDGFDREAVSPAPPDEARPTTRGDVGYFAAEAYDAAVQAFEATRFGYEMRPDSELWSQAYDALTKACDALAAIRRST